jgi:glycosyl transferase family 2
MSTNAHVVVVIPTRNRAHLAINAIRSVIDQPVEQLQILVSDNSTEESECRQLAHFCEEAGDSRLQYARPPEPLAMSAHWDWAMGEALRLYDASHFIYLTDRMMFRKDALKDVVALANVYPDRILSYNHDRIIDDKKPVRLEQYPASEKLLEVDTLRLSWLYSQSQFSHALPRMLNCIVPRQIIERLREQFQTVFSSIAPDFNFCCRCLEIEPTILYYDRSPLFHYALDRSNGASVTRGEMTVDNADFTANLPVEKSRQNYATPIPQLITSVNCVFNEYFIFKHETNSSRFFEVDLQKYLRANAEEIKEVIDPRVRSRMRALLIEHGLQENPNGLAGDAVSSGQGLRQAARSFLKNLTGVRGRAASSSQRKLAQLLTARNDNAKLPEEINTEFSDLDQAIDYARNVSRGNFSTRTNIVELLQARELPLPHGANSQ